MTDQPPDRILRLNAVLDRTGLSRATLYRKIQDGTFPKQVRIATRCATERCFMHEPVWPCTYSLNASPVRSPNWFSRILNGSSSA